MEQKMNEPNTQVGNGEVLLQDQTVTDVQPKPAKQVRKLRQVPHTLAEAKKDSNLNKLLFDLSKLQEKMSEPHVKLLHLVFKYVLEAQVRNVIDFFNQLSLLKEYSSNVGMNLYYDNHYVKSVVDTYVPNVDQNKFLMQYLRLVSGLVEIINMNVLNTVVYIEKKRLSKLKLFSIIENVVFTQIIPSEINSIEQDFKHLLYEEISKLKTEFFKAKLTTN